MADVSLVLYLVSAVCMYCGIYHLVFYIRRNAALENLLYSVLCFVHVAYIIAQAKWYSAYNAFDALLNVQFAYSLIVLATLFLLWFFYYYTGEMINRTVLYISTVFLLFISAMSMVKSELTVTVESAFSRELNLFGFLNTTVIEFQPGILLNFFFLSVLVSMLYVFIIVIKYYQKRFNTVLKLMPVAFAIVLVCSLIDVVTALGVIDTIYLSEFAYPALVLTMGFRLMNDFIDAQFEVEELNRSLDAKVEERTMELSRKNSELQNALEEVDTLSGLLPICASCKKIRDDKGYWNQIEQYISAHSAAKFSHGICPGCMKKLYPDYADEIDRDDKPPG